MSFSALEYIINLIYDGQANVRMESLNEFLAAARYLKINGFFEENQLSDASSDSGVSVSSDEIFDSSNISSTRYCHETSLNSSQLPANCGNYMRMCNEKRKNTVENRAVINPDPSREVPGTSGLSSTHNNTQLIKNPSNNTTISQAKLLSETREYIKIYICLYFR